MTTGTPADLARDLERLLGGASVAGRDDADLLERFARRGDPEAFEALVLRHGPRVRGLCRRLVGDQHIAEDAAQATWLVLARRARSIRLERGGSLGPWLHGVAVRVSRRARAVAARRETREASGDALDARPAAPAPDPAERERWAILHEEVDRLPPAERAALVLCYWEGLTHREAAERLGGPSGTVNVRVKRARDRLRDRLARRGLAGAGGLALLDSLGGPAAAAAPTGGTLATRIAADRLAAEVIRTMTLSKLSKIGAAACIALAASAGGMIALGRTQDGPARPADRDDPPATKPDADRPADDPPPNAAPARPAEPVGKPDHQAPDTDELRRTLREAAKAAEAIEDTATRAKRLAAIAKSQAGVDDLEAARQSFRSAVRSLGTIEALRQPVPEAEPSSGQAFQAYVDYSRLCNLLTVIAQDQAEAGLDDDAMATVALLPPGRFMTFTESGSYAGPWSRVETILRILTIQAQRGDFDRARETLDTLELGAESRLSKLGEIALLQAKAGQVAEAKAWINRLDDPNERSLLLANVAAGIQLRLQEAAPPAYVK
jgi:RNA polymerase sigma factor (sigma-70 family)